MKKYLINILALVLSVVMCNGVFAAGGINTGGGAVPFGSNTQYNYGIMPTNLPTSGTYGASQKAAEAYNAWKNAYVKNDCGNGVYRVVFDDGYSTVSEGIAYGMLLSVYADDKDLFDGLWKYYQNNMNGNGVMNWKISGCSGVSGGNGATDAELDAAMALIIASEQWGSSYGTAAKSLIQTIKRTEMGTDGQTLNGDAWGNTNSCRNPSYFAPAYYKEFAKVDATNETFWGTTAISASDKVLKANMNTTSGLVSNWCDNSGTENSCGNTGSGANGYGADACRNPWRMTVDYLWHGNDASSGAKTINGKLINFVKGYENQLKGPFPNRNVSNPGSGSYINGSYTTLALPTMTSSDAQSSLNKCYTNIANLQDVDVYFNSTIRCLSLFVLTGNFWAPGASGFVFPPTVSAAETDATGLKITLTMSKTMTAGTSSGSNFTVYYNGTVQSGIVSAVKANSDKSVELTLSTAPKPGQTISLSYNGNGGIKSSESAALEAFTKIEVLNLLAGNSTIIDDCEDGNEFNNVGGIWFTYTDGANKIKGQTCKPQTYVNKYNVLESVITPLSSKKSPFSMTSTSGLNAGSACGDYLVHVHGQLGTQYSPLNDDWDNPAFVGLGTYVDDDETAEMDWSNATGISFRYKGPAVKVQIVSNSVTVGGADYYYVVSASENSWTNVTIKWDDLAQPDWASPKQTLDKTRITKIQWMFESGTTGDPSTTSLNGKTFDAYIDNLELLNMAPVELTKLTISPVSDDDLKDDDCHVNIDPLKIPIASEQAGDTLYLETTPTPSDASYPVVFWSSSDEDVVTVDYKGRVIGVGYGEATITARSKMHQNISATYTVKVPAPAVKPTAIDFEESSYEVTVGETATIIPTFSPTGVTETGLTWTSSDQTKATVSSSGVVTGIAPGSVTITATSTSVSSVEKTVTVTVKDVAVTEVTVEEDEVSLELGDSKTVTASVLPAAVSQEVTASSSNEFVATVAVSGNTITISSVAVGDAVITVKSKVDQTISTTIAVTVTGVAITAVEISGTETSVQVGNTISLTASVSPSSAPQTVTWSSSDDMKATVTGGVVTGVATGTVTIKAASTEDATKFAEYEVTITAVPVASVTVTPSTKTLSVGEETQLAVSVKPDNAGDKSVTWSSTDATVATVDTEGNVTAVKAGSCKIIATANDGSEVAGECSLTVENVLPTSITMSTTLGFTLGDAAQTLTPTIAPTNATVKTVSWESSDETIATVVNGVVTPIGVGSCTITATADGDNTVTAECQVSVVASTVNVTGVTLDETATVYLGQTTTLTATVTPDDATNKSVTWSSSDETVATVDANGVVTGVKLGNATITVKTVDGEKTATCDVTVENVAITSIELSKSTLTLSLDDDPVELVASYLPENATNVQITWSSDNAKVATVVNGIVTPVGVGTANITAANGSISDVCVVTVSAISVTGVTLDKPSAEISVGGSVALTATVAPENASDKSVTWLSSNNDIATVVNGIVSGVAAGSATITVTTTDGSKTATCAVTVKANTIAVTGVTISPADSKSVALNESLTFTATISPSTATIKDVEWSSSDESVAVVSNGEVTLKKAGKTTITVTTVDGNFTATCELTVTDVLATTIIIDNALSLTVGESKSLTLTVLPADAAQTATWSSTDESVATVDATGKVTAVAKGSTKITAKTTDGTNLTSDPCEVTVSNVSVTAVSLDATSKVIRLNSTATLVASVTPANATIKDINWSSSKEAVATVSNGTVTAVAVGTTTITAASAEDAYTKATCAVEVVDASNLSVELTTANATYSSAVEGTNVGQYKTGSKSTFMSGISAAQAVFDNADASQTDIDAALADLKDAEKVFAKALISNETLIFNAELKQENMTQMATYWFSFDDGTASEDPTKCGSSVVTPLATEENPFTMTEPGYNGSGKSAMIQYTLEGEKALTYKPFVGMGMNFDKTAGVPFDMTGSTGVSFYIKSDSKVYFEVEMTTITDAGDYYAYLGPYPEWTLVELNWSDLEQYNWAVPQDWDLTQLTKCQWKVQEPDGETGKLWVDEVKILGVALDLPEIVDYDELYIAIADAQAVLEDAVVGTKDGNYPQKAVTALEGAIKVAEGVIDNAKTQAIADKAVTTLRAAIETFENAQIVVDRTALQAKIETAEDYYINAQEGYQEGMYLVGSKAILMTAIEAAQVVMETSEVDQTTIDKATSKLQTAIETFLDSKFDPSSINKNALETALNEANTLYAAAVEGAGNGQYQTGSKAVFYSAISDAQSAYDNTSVSQEQIDQATTMLNAAISAFKSAMITVDKTKLNSTISSANALYATAVEGVLKGNYPVGAKATLMDAINAAQSVYDGAGSSQMEVNQAITTLNTAIETFKASVITVDKSALSFTLQKANTSLAKAEGNTGDGSGQYPYFAVTDLTDKIAEAQSIYDNATNQIVVNDAVTALEKAIKDFEASKNPEEANLADLIILIAEADELISKSVNPGNYLLEYLELATCNSNARAEVAKATHTQENVNTQAQRLAAAIEAFKAVFETAIDDVDVVQLIFYPNPCQNELNIVSGKVIKKIVITSVAGSAKLVVNADSESVQIDVTSIKAGTYSATIEYEDGSKEAQSFVKHE